MNWFYRQSPAVQTIIAFMVMTTWMVVLLISFTILLKAAL